MCPSFELDSVQAWYITVRIAECRTRLFVLCECACLCGRGKKKRKKGRERETENKEKEGKELR